jgi:hypothetical protein
MRASTWPQEKSAATLTTSGISALGRYPGFRMLGLFRFKGTGGVALPNPITDGALSM